MRWLRLILVSLATLAAAPALACIPIAPVCGDGPGCNPTPDERRLQERRSSAEETRRLTIDALDRLRKRRADPAAELAEALVPNIRPVRIEVSDCGPVNEVDPAAGRETIESIFAEVAGADAAGSEWSDYDDLFRIDDIYPFGERCNAEFRGRFAEFLRRRSRPIAFARPGSSSPRAGATIVKAGSLIIGWSCSNPAPGLRRCAGSSRTNGSARRRSAPCGGPNGGPLWPRRRPPGGLSMART